MAEFSDFSPSADASRTAVRPRRQRLRQALLGAAAVLGIAAAAQVGVHYWQVGRFLVSTDDAYVQADSTIVAPRISGYVAEVLVTDNQRVKAGQVLARIDDRDFRTALRQAEANRETAETEIASIDAQLRLQQSAITQAASQVASAEAALTFARQDQARYAALARNGAGSLQQAQQTASLLLQRGAALAQAQAGLTAAQQQVEVLKAARAKAAAQRDHAIAVQQQAGLNLGYTTITAPIDGVVGARTLRVGQFVQAGTQLMALVPLDGVYVVANFKETQITDVRRGQKVRISVDTFPDMAVTGRVDSVAPATGLQFALLPPDNATGNFTKIVQRIPVKIVLDPQAGSQAVLRPGMSVEPTVDTRPDTAS
ncbi:HlyD family secretion protein [Rhodovastum atsumiense]|nr:HlyD family secretion protein [Rhodovastum atsumiense]CAH2601831.1 HlyD family secretion protein [Rhodovastum atsumiense]